MVSSLILLELNLTFCFVLIDKNILTNLNEVRKIMQSDHIEMLENLLNCNK